MAGRIVPHLWYDKEAKEAARFYCSVFPNSRIEHETTIHDTPSPGGDCDIVRFSLDGNPFIAISAGPLFRFNESVSFVVRCKDQEEIDYYWSKLSAVPASEQCGWCKDRFGLSWQVVPAEMDRMMADGDPAKVARVVQAFLAMKKLDLAALRKAYEK